MIIIVLDLGPKKNSTISQEQWLWAGSSVRAYTVAAANNKLGTLMLAAFSGLDSFLS